MIKRVDSELPADRAVVRQGAATGRGRVHDTDHAQELGALPNNHGGAAPARHKLVIGRVASAIPVVEPNAAGNSENKTSRFPM